MLEDRPIKVTDFEIKGCMVVIESIVFFFGNSKSESIDVFGNSRPSAERQCPECQETNYLVDGLYEGDMVWIVRWVVVFKINCLGFAQLVKEELILVGRNAKPICGGHAEKNAIPIS